MSNARHVIKYEYSDGVKLDNPVLWCGLDHNGSFCFSDAQHVALSVGGYIQPCKKCIKAIIRELEKEL